MAVSEDELKAVKAYMKAPDDDDDIVRACYAAARIYLKNAGIEVPEEDPDLYNLALWSLTLHYYDHRDAVGTEAEIPIGLRPIIGQLQRMGDVARSVSE